MIRNKAVTPVASIVVLLLAPLALGAKGGCTHAVVGDEGECKTNCGEAGMGDGTSGGSGGSSGGHATGGAPATGGSMATGGGHATGGAPAAGGSTATGGSHATGGAPATGGSMATGGGPATGGTAGMATGGGSGTGGSSAICGGFPILSCADGEFCDYPPGAECGGTEGGGTCRAIPEVCGQDFAPVCGCDGMTYSNACAANMNGVSVEASGECATPGDQPCGGLAGLTCDDGEYCDFPLSTQCGAADQTGTCQPVPEGCTKEYAPVCGCDDKTYGNACEAHAAGIAVAATGECATTPDFCGGIAGIGCPDGQYCSFPPEAHCGDGDMTGSCAEMPGGCTQQYDPVCGCDGTTYGNACDAAMHGVSVQATGECPR